MGENPFELLYKKLMETMPNAVAKIIQAQKLYDDDI